MSVQKVDWAAADASVEIDRSVKSVSWATPGSTAGLRNLEEFINERLKIFNTHRNDPTRQALSNMSPWYHFGENEIATLFCDCYCYPVCIYQILTKKRLECRIIALFPSINSTILLNV